MDLDLKSVPGDLWMNFVVSFELKMHLNIVEGCFFFGDMNGLYGMWNLWWDYEIHENHN
jgi:hypothetical protein